MSDIKPQCGGNPPIFDCGQPDLNQAYCCSAGDSECCPPNGFIFCDADQLCSTSVNCSFQFPQFNDENEPMLKSVLNGTSLAPFARIAFEQYCTNPDGSQSVNKSATLKTVLTMGNVSQPGDADICRASLKAFQYGWGATDSGVSCRATVVDEKGGQFESWIQRMAKNSEGDTTPVAGAYRLMAQFGWYVEGGGDGDICGQPTANPNIQPLPGENHSFLVCSPTMYFMILSVNARYEGNKFVYDIEGSDSLVRSQQNKIASRFGEDDKQMYFVEAVKRLGLVSTPPFRVEFYAPDNFGVAQRLQFVKREGHDSDDECWGPFDVWPADERPPLAVIHEWIRTKAVRAKDLTGKTPTGEVGIVLNFDPTYIFDKALAQCTTKPCGDSEFSETETEFCDCDEKLPQYGRVLMWASGIPYCQADFTSQEINDRMNAVYVVNGGDCSPVYSFNPVFKWQFYGAADAGSTGTLLDIGTQEKQQNATVKTKCAIASSRGPTTFKSSPSTRLALRVAQGAIQQGKAAYHQTMANLLVHSIEAEMRVQGDPSPWLCTPLLTSGGGDEEGYTKCIGIIFVNPQFLVPDPDHPDDCPIWTALDQSDDKVCNTILTNKGWFVKGADHQIKDGTYVTTLKLVLPSPGAELADASDGVPVHLGGDPNGGSGIGGKVVEGGQYACLERYPVGSAAADWGQSGGGPCNVPSPALVFKGGGTACEGGYS